MKKISENIWEFDPQVYPKLLWVAVNPNEELEQSKFKSLHDKDEPLLKVEMDDCLACVYVVRKIENCKTGSMIVFKDLSTLTSGIIAHEAVHVVSNLCRFIGLKYNEYDDEHISYLVEWVVNCCDKVKNEIENGNRTM